MLIIEYCKIHDVKAAIIINNIFSGFGVIQSVYGSVVVPVPVIYKSRIQTVFAMHYLINFMKVLAVRIFIRIFIPVFYDFFPGQIGQETVIVS